MLMLDPKPVFEFIKELNLGREAVISALLVDKRSRETQKKLADWKAGYPVLTVGGQSILVGTTRIHLSTCPEGETTRLLNLLRPRYGNGGAKQAYQLANAAVLEAGLGKHFLPHLERAFNAHITLLDDALEAYEQSRSVNVEAHCSAVDVLINAIQLYENRKANYDTSDVWRMAAIQMIIEDPGLKDCWIADEIRISQSTLSTDWKYKLVRDTFQEDIRKRHTTKS